MAFRSDTSSRLRLPASRFHWQGLLSLVLAALALVIAEPAPAQEQSPEIEIGGGGVGPDYRLAARDLVLIEMFNQKDVRTSQRLTANGEIRLPLIGRVDLMGLTVREAELRIEELFKDGGYYVDPQVMIVVEQYSDRFVSVFGQVRNPARIPFPSEAKSIGILQAVTLAGGFTRIARTDQVQVSRTNREGVEERFVVDVGELFNSRRPAERREFLLLPGDVVFVPERTF